MSATLTDLMQSRGGIIEEGPNGSYPLRFQPLEVEVKTIEKGAGILPREQAGVILVRGPEAQEFLNGLTSNDFAKLRVGGLQPHLFCAGKGKIRFEVEVVRTKPEE